MNIAELKACICVIGHVVTKIKSPCVEVVDKIASPMHLGMRVGGFSPIISHGNFSPSARPRIRHYFFQ